MSRAIWLVLIGIVSVQGGAAIAKGLFDVISPTSLVFLRLLASTMVLLAVARPSWRGRSRSDWLVVAAFGTSLGVMNWTIYQSFARIPLGIAVTIEFIGPLTLAVLGSRRVQDLIWVGLAAAGVVLLGFERTRIDLAGVAFALIAGLAWACYILLSAETGKRWPGFDGLAIASAVATLLLTAPAILSDGRALLDPHVLMLGALIGVLSSVIPYSCELVALRTLQPSVFGILMSLEPAAAALAAVVVLNELLSPLQWLAVTCVVLASVGATRSRPVLLEPAPD